MSDHSELKRRAEEVLEIERAHPCGSTRVILVNPATVLELLAEVEALHAQHGRDSAELRSLCQARDDTWKDRDSLKAEVERLTSDNASLRGSCAKLGAEHAGMVRQIKKLKGAKP